MSLPPDMIEAIQREVGDQPWRRNWQCRESSIYAPICRAVGLDRESTADRKTIDRYLSACIRCGALRQSSGLDRYRKPVEFVSLGLPAAECGTCGTIEVPQ